MYIIIVVLSSLCRVLVRWDLCPIFSTRRLFPWEQALIVVVALFAELDVI
jgi:hypothetical protein